MIKKLFITCAIVLILIATYLTYTYKLAPEKARNNGKEFVKECNNLNSKPFTLNNISTINGFIDSNGRERISINQFDNFVKNNTNDKGIKIESIRIYKDSFFKGPNIKYSWICEIKKDLSTDMVISSSGFYLTD